MADLFEKKRESLETFIREQMIGPNGCRGKYAFASEDYDEKTEEVINTTPGSIYSTGILFPSKEEGKDDTNNNEKEKESSSTSKYDDKSDYNDENAEDPDAITRSEKEENNGSVGDSIDDDDICSINRRFPNMIGITCCLDSKVDLNKDVTIIISGRYYDKIRKDDKQKVQVLILHHSEEFEKFWEDNSILYQYFTYSDKRLSINKIEEAKKVKEQLDVINKNYAVEIAMEFGVLEEVETKYRYLRSYREKIFNNKLSRLSFKNKQDKKYGYLSEEEKNRYISAIKKIEVYETIISYFEELLDLYNWNSFGFWRSHTFSKTISLEKILFNSEETKIVFNPENNPELKHIIHIPLNNNTKRRKKEEKESFLSLSLWLQTTRNSKNKKDENIYLKALLENSSSPFIESSSNYFSIVNEEVNKLCFFGIKIEIESDFIKPYHENIFNDNDDSSEEAQLNFLYRDIKDYAVGHYCSVNWDVEKSTKVKKVYTEFLPSYEIPDIEPIPRNTYGDYIEENGSYVPEPYLKDNEVLQFKWLSIFSECNDKTIIDKLNIFIETYKIWIERKRKAVMPEEEKFAKSNMDLCMSDCQRMLDNVNGILTKPENMKVFRLMNSAMFMQLWHNASKNQKYLKDRNIRKTDITFYRAVDDDIFSQGEHASWRPFQLAFILLNLDGIIRHPQDLLWEHRNEIVDLVWFPTGGGKTEAYLGIIALCIIYRRQLYKEKGYGVAAIMRYTLRLLTTQQFQRALRLIMALEEMRSWHDDVCCLGDEQISIGLYVGANSLPNQFRGRDGLDEEAIKWHSRDEGSNKTRIPLDRCPWCGEKLDYDNGEFVCLNERCTFSEIVLPVKLCDEHIYNTPPSLLLGTVDKFAAISHKVSKGPKEKAKDSRRIFGKGADYNCLPPDLIIQDELHLLLGPLGSAVSLFECAIDKLCSRKESIEGKSIIIRPKIISSTATTRNTELQIRALYDREVNIFPKNGVSYDDSFFSFYKRKKENDAISYVSKRKYIGIMPTGRTQMTTEMRLAAILFVHRAIFEYEHSFEPNYENVADNYYSIISYFNSLREVGKTDAMFYTEYLKYVQRLYKRVMCFENLLECFYSMKELKEAELTGRISGSDINEVFSEVEQKWSLRKRLPHEEIINGDKQWVRGYTPPDYIIATNMISVGLDVGRFNTIIMNSMPRNIAEYIQASSRVARNKVGLVLTLHNPFRSRDVSHFEKFREFHEKLYYYVEPISITPFSHKSIEKYLPLCLAAMIRHTFEELSERKDAKEIKKEELFKKVKSKVVEYFSDRCDRTKELKDVLQRGLLTEDLQQFIIKFVNKAFEQWKEMAENGNLVYYISAYNKNPEQALFTTPMDYDDTKNQSYWTVPQSLRIIEPEAVLHIEI